MESVKLRVILFLLVTLTSVNLGYCESVKRRPALLFKRDAKEIGNYPTAKQTPTSAGPYRNIHYHHGGLPANYVMSPVQYYAKLPASGIQYAPSSIAKAAGGGGTGGHYASNAYRTPYLTHLVAPHPEPKQQYQYAPHTPFTYFQPTTQQHHQHQHPQQQQQYAIIPAVTDAYQHPYYPHHRFALQAPPPAAAPPSHAHSHPHPHQHPHQLIYALAPPYNTQQHGIQLALIAPMTIHPSDGKLGLGGGIQYATSPISTASPSTTTTSAATTTSTQKSAVPTYTHLTLIPSVAASSKPDGSTAAANLIFSAAAGPQLYQAQNGAFYAFTYNPSQSPAASSTAIHYVTIPRQQQETSPQYPSPQQLTYTTTQSSSSQPQHSSAVSITASPSTTTTTGASSNKFTKSLSNVQIVNHADAVPYSETSKPSAFKVSQPVAVSPTQNPYYGLGPIFAMAPKYYAYQTGDTFVQPTSDYLQYGSHLYHPTSTHPQAIRVIQTVPVSPPPQSAAITTTSSAAPTSSSSVATSSNLPERTVVKYP
ncbi:hypothetical protein ACFFRR_002828 [Megaselia abdita]